MRLTRLTFVGLLSIFVLFSCSSESDEPTPEPDVIAPVVDFSILGSSSSSNSETPIVSNQIVVEIDANDAGGVAKVEAFINNEKVGEDTTAPYQITIDVSIVFSAAGARPQRRSSCSPGRPPKGQGR